MSYGRSVGAVLLVAGIVAGAMLPKLLKLSRVSVKSIAGTRLISGVPARGRANADPALARPA